MKGITYNRITDNHNSVSLEWARYDSENIINSIHNFQLTNGTINTTNQNY